MITNFHFFLFLSYLVSNYPTRVRSSVICLANNCETCEAGQSVRCATCVSDYYLDSSKNCNKCPQGCKTCTSSIGPCSSCSVGYFLNLGTCGTCPNNCAYCTDRYACTVCNDFFLLKTVTSATTNCIKPDCSAEATRKYILLNDLSCTDCTGIGESLFNKEYCQKTIKAPFMEITKVNDEIFKFSYECETAKNFYLIGGVGGYPFVSLEKIQDRMNYPYFSQEVKLKNSGFLYKYSIKAGVTYYFTNPFKITGEKYNFVGYCEYLGIKSIKNNWSYLWNNNTKLESLVIKLKSTANLSLKITLVKFAIQSVLKTEKDVWLNEDELEENASSFTYTFYILPNYFTSIEVPDFEITNLKTSILNDPAKFAVDVANEALLYEVSLTVVSALSFVTTDAIPYIEEEYPIINVKANTFQMTLKQIVANGTLYWAYRISTPDDLKIGRSTMAEENYEAISFDGIGAATAGLRKQKVSKDQVITASVSGLNYNTKYTIFYYGTNNGMPKIKTLIYTNIIQTDPASCPNNCAQCDPFSGKCQSCSEFYSLNSLENICKLDCSKDPIKKYQLITELSCTDCKSPGYSIYNATHCHNLLVPKITITVSNIGVTTLDLVCNSGSTFYWAYGLAQSASLALAQIQTLIKNSVTDPLYYRTVGFDEKYKGGYQSSTVNLNTILSNIKNSGEDYTLVAFCEYLGASSTATTTFKSFNNPKLEVLLISLAASTTWTSSQKSAVAGAIGFALGTKKYVWTDENKYVAGSASTRILENYNAQFYIYPDYTINNGLDNEISNLNRVMSQDPAQFLSAVNLKVAQPGFNLIQVTTNTYVASSSAPNLVTTYPNIVADVSSFEMILRQGGADGTLNWAYKAKSSWKSNNFSVIPDDEFATYIGINLNHTPAIMDTDIKINVTGLFPNTSYDVYYYGKSYGISNLKTPIYSQIITTLANSTSNYSKTNGISSTNTIQRLIFSFFLFLIIIFI